MDSLIAKADAVNPLSKNVGKSKTRPSRSSSTPGSSLQIRHRRNQGQSTSSTPNVPSKSSKLQQKPADRTVQSITQSTALPRSLRPSSPPPESTKRHGHIKNKKLRLELDRQAEQTARAKASLKDVGLLTQAVGTEGGTMEVEGDIEKTWRVGQSEIVHSVGMEAAKGRKEMFLDGGPYKARYSRNGRHLAIVGKKGHVATFDWQTGTMHAELQLKETCRDITFLHDQSHFAVAQQKYVFIYDRDGVELHKLASHVEPTRLEFLPYHWLLASVGYPGYLKYQDTSTGQIVVEHRTKFGPCKTMTQNLHNAVIHLGHQNGTVTLWTPNLSQPAVRLLAHLGGVTSVSVDPSNGGKYMATAGMDGKVKVWDCRNWKGAVREWTPRGGTAVVEWSQKGALAVATGGTANVYMPPAIHNAHKAHAPPPLYLTHPIPHRPLTSLRFCPFQDILTIGHEAGLSSILVPGTGEPNFDSSEANPFENKRARREREVRSLLDKIQPDMITLDPEFIGSMAPPSKLTGGDVTNIPFARLPRLERLKLEGKADESEDVEIAQEGRQDEEPVDGKPNDQDSRAKKEKMKMRGKSKSLKRYLRKKRKNVIDHNSIALRKQIEKLREERRRAKLASLGKLEERKPSALDRFKRSS